MAYVFKRIPDVTKDVPVDVPDLPKNAKRPTLRVRYRLLSHEELRAFYDTKPENQIGDDELMARDILDFPGGITWQEEDEHGNHVGKPYQREFSPEFLDEMMNITFMRDALVLGWLTAQKALPESAEKNSRGLVGTLQA